MKIYLAGKISKNCWRHGIVKDLRDTEPTDRILPGAIFDKHDYVGPFFESCDHGCNHILASHGASVETCGVLEVDEDRRRAVRRRCLEGVAQADLVFAWVDDVTCFGTLFEIGYAHGLKKKIVLAAPAMPPELWFAFSGHEMVLTSTPAEALKQFFASMESEVLEEDATPIEQKFAKAWKHAGNPRELAFQHQIGKYRVDFAHVPTRTAIELDGSMHGLAHVVENDRRRQRAIEDAGWHFIRFGGREVHRNADACVREALARIQQRE